MNVDKTIEDFRTGKLELDCRRMVLSQSTEGGERYEGKGYIRQDADGGLVYKIYVTGHENASPHEGMIREMSLVGKVHPDEHFFDLVAEARDGTEIHASRLIPWVCWSKLGEPELIRGPLFSVTATNKKLPQTAHVLELFFFEEYSIPKTHWNDVEEVDGVHSVADGAEFEACGVEFKARVRAGSGRSVVEVAGSEPFPPDYHWRIQEALQFIVGRTAVVSAVVTCGPGFQTVELISPARSSARPHFCPPISHASIEYHRHGWTLFGSYLEYIVKMNPPTQWHPLGYHLYIAREASANSIDSWAMGVSVALEAVASLVSIPDEQEEPSGTDAAVEKLKRYVAGEADLADIKERLDGLLSMLKQPPGPRGKLEWLAGDGRVEGAYIKQWTKLRNALVHPKLGDLKQPDQATVQKQLDRIHCVQVLLYQITYYLIGYSGPYTDYGAEGFPIKKYPLEAPRPIEG
ncbi:hypothetical protein [Burkholderia vietnamiensis]|uniref:hypothetical protein n=1 Tax=Burkholderia vietnamiensis TaxID=60552 RepID=UPI001B921FCA|nr:hypothetical protein [Burkholderia vietnamiensis]MBR8034725.1 hypothetical protein [Burkholderia vietnamiensis]